MHRIYHRTPGTHLAQQACTLGREDATSAIHPAHSTTAAHSDCLLLLPQERSSTLLKRLFHFMLTGRTNSDESARLYVNTLKRLFLLEHNFAKFLLKFSSFSLPHTTHAAEILLIGLQLLFLETQCERPHPWVCLRMQKWSHLLQRIEEISTTETTAVRIPWKQLL